MSVSFKLRNGFLLLSTEAPGGVYNSAQLKKIASLCDGESAIVKATEDQRLALFVQPEKAKHIAVELKSVGLGIRNYQDGLHQPTNCIGAHCPEHLQDAMTSAMDVTQELAKITLETPLRIGINGCARCCVPTHTLDISVVGDSAGYRVSLGGKNSQIPEMATFMAEGVPAVKLPQLIAKVVGVYKELAHPDESLQDVIERSGAQGFIEALAPYSQDAHQDDPFAGLSEGDANELAAGGGAHDLSVTSLEGDVAAAPEITDDFDIAAFDTTRAPAFEAEGTGMDSEDIDVSGGLSESSEQSDATERDEGEFAVEFAAEEFKDERASQEAIDEAEQLDDSFADEVPLASSEVGDGDETEAHNSTALDDYLAMEDDEGSSLQEDDSNGALVNELATAESSLDEPLLDDDQLLTSFEPEQVGEGEMLADELSDDEKMQGWDMGADEGRSPLNPESLTTELAMGNEIDVPSAQGEDDLDDDPMLASEVDENEADAFEEKLNASIAEEENSLVEEDENVGDRIEAMRLVEASDGEDLASEYNSGDLEMDARDGASDSELGELSVEGEASSDDVQVVESGNFDHVETGASVKAIRSGLKAMEFVGLDFAEGGRVSLRFSNGATMSFDLESIAVSSSRELNLAGKRVNISPSEHGVHVEVDGVGVFLPRSAA